jgi:hypothetical protein
MITWKKFNFSPTNTRENPFGSSEHRCFYLDTLVYRSKYTLYEEKGHLKSGYVVYDSSDKFIAHFDTHEDVVSFCEREIKIDIINGDNLGKEG